MTHQEYLAEERLKFYVSDDQIYSYYFGDIVIGKKYVSPLRNRDPNPSLVFRYVQDKLYWKDFGLTSSALNDAINYVAALLSFTDGGTVTRSEAVDTIFNELVKGGKAPKRKRKVHDPLILPYEVTYDNFNEEECLYWLKMGLYEKDTDLFNIKGVRGLYRNCKFIRKSMPGDPMFVYLTEERDTFKIYRPYAVDKTTKFRGQQNGHILEGYNALPRTGTQFILNSSLKDTAVIRKAGFFGANPTSENSFIALFNKAREINERFTHKLIFFDNDRPGIIAAAKLKQILGWDTCYLPQGYPKDPSDLVMETGNYFYLNCFLDTVTKKGARI